MLDDSADDQTKALVIENIEFAEQIARRFYKDRQNIGIDLDDYIGAAMLGLCDAACRYDPERSESFRTFSFLRIRGAMYDLMRKGGGIPKAHFSDLVLRSERSDESSSRLPFAVAKDRWELAHLAVIVEEWGLRLHLENSSDDAELSYVADTDPETAASNRDLSRYISQILEELPLREQEIVRRRYYESETFDEMRDEFEGVSKSWLSRLHNRALQRIKKRMLMNQHKCAQKVEAYAA